METKLSWRWVVPWVFLLAFLSVGLRNFEEGISQDAPLYATMARAMVRTGDWFRMQSGVPDFQPFASHPHLGIWIHAVALKLLPTADWALRVPNHLFFVAFLLLLFGFLRSRHDERTAVLAVFLLVLWYRFTNPFSNVKLDPSFLFFGTASVFLLERAMRAGSPSHALAAGALLGCAFLTKGMAALGWGIAWALLYAVGVRRKPRRWKEAACGVAALLACLAAYVFAVKRSSVPEFFTLHFANLGNLKGELWSLKRLLSWWYPKQIMEATYGLAPLAFLSLRQPFRLATGLGWALLGGFLFLYAPAGLAGIQYWLTVLPWIAWLIAVGVAPWIPVASAKLIRVSAAIAIAGICLVQYLPYRTHGILPQKTEMAVKEQVRRGTLATLHLETPKGWEDYITASRYTWYADLSVTDYADKSKPPPAPSPRTGYMLQLPEGSERQAREQALRATGWCLIDSLSAGSLWGPCGSSR